MHGETAHNAPMMKLDIIIRFERIFQGSSPYWSTTLYPEIAEMDQHIPEEDERLVRYQFSGPFMNTCYELTEEETIYYANYGLIDTCDCCGEEFPITNYYDGENYLTFEGNQLLCQKCIK